MANREDIESYLMKAGIHHEEVERDMWVVHDTGSSENIVVRLAGPLVIFRVKVMEVARVERKTELFQKLLELNAEEMVHASYGFANGAVVLTCSLLSENLDYNEFQGTIDDFSLALTNHYEMLASFRSAA